MKRQRMGPFLDCSWWRMCCNLAGVIFSAYQPLPPKLQHIRRDPVAVHNLGRRLWAQVWFGQPITLRVPRKRDSSGESAEEPTRDDVRGDLDALLSDQEIDELEPRSMGPLPLGPDC
jgi:hypothetical protein